LQQGPAGEVSEGAAQLATEHGLVCFDASQSALRGTQEGLLIHAFSTTALKLSILEGETDPRQGWVAADYGDHHPAPMLVYSVTAPLPVRIVTLLLPTDTLLASPPSVSPVTEGGWIRGLVLDDGHARHAGQTRRQGSDRSRKQRGPGRGLLLSPD